MPYESHCKQTKNQKNQKNQKKNHRANAAQIANQMQFRQRSFQTTRTAPCQQPNEWYLKKKKKKNDQIPVNIPKE
jgi:hypothetical protein